MKALNELYEQIDSQTMANYLCARFLLNEHMYLDGRFHRAEQTFVERLSGIKDIESRKNDSLEMSLLYLHKF